MIEFLLPSIIAGIGIALIAGPLGSFVVWRRMAYFGDTLAHASLMGLALGFLFNINLYLALVICCMALAIVLVTLQNRSWSRQIRCLGYSRIVHSRSVWLP
ncbi:zinc ABC transporter inner membrane permease protein ZnuB [Vibrio variabilis]|uniref:High-affinity zinc uptake system membrane protein ZnuB n=1 Tax=Vibrio variabilis TaxID=990271 RepID=A0ABQ0J4F4_9VIBR|nr:zinc ABC transporter inner membrane permease protein ZnuB [Vibrio variabilis]